MLDSGLIFFMKYPERGLVKNRLAEELGDDLTVRLYSNFVLDVLETCQMVEAETIIAYSISNNMKNKKLFWNGEFKDFPQKGDDPGKKIFNAMSEASKMGYKKCVVIGTDSPDLPAAVIGEAFEMLNECDAVIGPGSDGGYYLLGLAQDKIDPKIFEKIKWGSPSVFEDIHRNIKKCGLTNHVLPEWDDIEDINDLKRYYSRYRYHRNGSNTMDFLRENQELLERWLN